MRSYDYHQGIWTAISDPLPREADKQRDPAISYQPGMSWGDTTRKFDMQKLTYESARLALGFAEHSVRLECQLGGVYVYARDHVDLPGERDEDEFGYDFFCVLRFAGTYIRIWIEDLPNLFLFLREIDVHAETEQNESTSEALLKIFYDENMQELILYVKWLAEQIHDGDLALAIKPYTPKKKA